MNVLEHLVKVVARLGVVVDRLPKFLWGTVRGASPVRVLLDSGELVDASASLCAPRVGDRALCVLFGNRLVLLGVVGGASYSIPVDNKVIVNGREYEASGVFASVPPVGQTADYPPVYCGHIDFPTPYAPPPGYGFTVHVLGTSGYAAGLEVYDQNSTRIRTRVMQVGSKNLAALNRVGWRLVKVV